MSEPIKNPDVSYEQRVTAANEWADSFNKLGPTLTKQPRQIWQSAAQYLAANSDVSEPVATPEGNWGLHRVDLNDKDAFNLVPIHEKDADLHPKFAALIGRVRYTEYENTIYVPFDAPLHPWAGIILLHEIYHVIAHHQNMFREGHELDHWLEEVEVYKKEIAVTRQLLGPRYRQAVTRRAAKMAIDMQQTSYINSKSFSPATIAFFKTLAPEDLALTACKTLFDLDAAYRMFQRLFPETYRIDQAKFTKWYYDTNDNEPETLA